MRFSPARTAVGALLGASILSCTDATTAVRQLRPGAISAASTTTPPPPLVISQVYGGGGNSGATFKNDFIEIFNPTGQSVDVDDSWSVQYASQTGAFTQVTKLARKTIPAGGYYLVQEAAGAGGSTSLPTPDATGSIAMAAGAGKVALVHSSTALGIACPAAGAYVDLLSYGSGTNCQTFTPTLTNTTAALRNDSGCAYTNDPSKDFATGAPAPRNGSTAVHLCPNVLPAGPLDHLAIAGPATIMAGTTAQLTATPQDANNQTVSDATISDWSSSDPIVATVDQTGKVTAVAGSANPITISAKAQEGGITVSGQLQITVNTPGINWVDVSSSSTSFPVGFQTQLFATARESQGGAIIDANFTFEALAPDTATIANVNNSGIITGVASRSGGAHPGFKITATPKAGGASYSFVTHSITIEAPVASPTSIYARNDEFGDPTPADPSNANDLLIVRPQYTLSYNEARGTPNWVAYELDARQIVAGQDRCNCFTADPLLPLDKQILTSDYTSGGYDRGHMTRSADRTTANLDNAATFYLTNIVPQQADLNQGVWAQFENALGDSATKGGRAVYIITGPLYSRSHALSFLKNEGKVAIPDSTWKVALIGPRVGGNPFTRGNVQSWDDLSGLTILAVSMPNVSGVRNDPWSKYQTTVHKIEEATGYSFLTVLNDAFRAALDFNDHSPTARYTISGTTAEGTLLTFDASASSDPDLSANPEDLGRTESLSYEWTFSDGGKATGRSVTHSFARFGSYSATLTVSDAFGWPSTVSQTLNVADVAPAVASLPGAELIAGETYSAASSFGDPGVDVWTATVNYGDGDGTQPLPLVGKSFDVAHTYANAGTFIVTVTVADDGGATGSASATVHVVTPLAATQALAQQLQLLGESGALAMEEVRPLLASLDATAKQIQRGNNTPAINELGAFVNKLNAAVLSGRLSPDAAQQLAATVARIQRVLGGS